MKKVFRRLAEPSTWAAVATLLAVGGVALPPGTAENAALVFSGLAGLAGVLMPEGARPSWSVK